MILLFVIVAMSLVFYLMFVSWRAHNCQWQSWKFSSIVLKLTLVIVIIYSTRRLFLSRHDLCSASACRCHHVYNIDLFCLLFACCIIYFRIIFKAYTQWWCRGAFWLHTEFTKFFPHSVNSSSSSHFHSSSFDVTGSLVSLSSFFFIPFHVIFFLLRKENVQHWMSFAVDERSMIPRNVRRALKMENGLSLFRSERNHFSSSMLRLLLVCFNAPSTSLNIVPLFAHLFRKKIIHFLYFSSLWILWFSSSSFFPLFYVPFLRHSFHSKVSLRLFFAKLKNEQLFLLLFEFSDFLPSSSMPLWPSWWGWWGKISSVN